MSKNVSRKNSIRIRIGNNRNSEQVFKAIIYHPMETGRRRKRRSNELIPADYIAGIQVSVDGKKYIELTLGKDVSKNPFLSFTFSKPLMENQKVEISWADNNNQKTTYDFVAHLNQDGYFSFVAEKEGSDIIQLSPQTGPICKTGAAKITP